MPVKWYSLIRTPDLSCMRQLYEMLCTFNLRYLRTIVIFGVNSFSQNYWPKNCINAMVSCNLIGCLHTSNQSYFINPCCSWTFLGNVYENVMFGKCFKDCNCQFIVRKITDEIFCWLALSEFIKYLHFWYYLQYINPL